MPSYAVISGNQVTNVIVADDKETVEEALGVTLVETGPDNPCGPGWLYDKDTGTFSSPDE